MRRADLVLLAIPGIVLAGVLAERTTDVLAATGYDPLTAVAGLPLFVLATLAALGLIFYEVLTARAVEK